MSDLRQPPPGLDRAVAVSSFDALDAMAVSRGLVGDTYPTGLKGYDARRACLMVDGTLYVSPARYNATTGAWPWPGHRPPRFTSSRDRRSDERAELENDRRLRGFDDAIASVDRRLYGSP